MTSWTQADVTYCIRGGIVNIPQPGGATSTVTRSGTCTACATPTGAQVYSLQYQNGSAVSPYFTIPSTNSSSPSGAITINDGGNGVNATTYPLMIIGTAWDACNSVNATTTTTSVNFTVTFVECCNTTTITMTPAFYATLTISALQTYNAGTQLQTLNWPDSVSTANGNLDGQTLCGPKTLTLISNAQTWLTVDNTTKTVKVDSTLANDNVGSPFTVQINQCLVNFPTICTSNQNMIVTITACSVTDITCTNSASYTGITNYLLLDNITFSYTFPTYTQTPACGYTPTYSMTLGGTALPTKGFSSSGTAISALDTDRTDAGSYDAVFTITLGACTGICSNNAITTTYVWKDLCTTSSLIASTVNAMTTGELITPASIQTVAYPKDTVSNYKAPADGYTYCGARTCTVDNNSILSFTYPTITLQSTSNTDNNASPYTATHTCQLSTAAYAVPSVFTAFTVTVNDCIVTSFTPTPTTYAEQTYTIGATALTISFPTYTQTPLCGFTVSYTMTYGGGASYSTTNNLVSITSGSSFVINSNDRTFKTTSQTQIVLTARLNNTAITINSAYNFWLNVVDPCLTTTITDQILSSITIDIQTTQLASYTFKDSASTAGGNLDGLTLCGARSSTFTYQLSGSSIAKPAFITETTTSSTGTLQISPLVTADQGSYTITLVICLTDTGLSAIPCLTKTISLTVVGCVLTSVTQTGTLANVNYITYSGAISTFTLPTFAQTPSCGYTQITTIYTSTGGAMLSFLSLTQANATNQYSINSNSIADVGVYSLKLNIKFDTGTYEYNTTTWTVTIQNPCTTVPTVLQPFDLTWIGSMTTSVLLGTSVLQPFTEPVDSYSLSNEIYDPNYPATQTHYEYNNIFYPDAWDPTPYDGAMICGQRTYTVTGATGCSTMLTVTNIGNKPGLNLIANMATQALGTYACIVTASLLLYPTVATVNQPIQIVITACQVTNIAVSASPSTLSQYFLMGTAVSVNFPTYTLTPACNILATYSCQTLQANDVSLNYPTGSAFTDSQYYPSASAITGLNGVTECNTATNQYNANIKIANPSINTLDAFVNNDGDYGIQISVSVSTPPMTNSDFKFVLRVVNPCLYTSFNTNQDNVLNTLIGPTVPFLQTSVLIANSTTFSAFNDQASTTDTTTADNYLLCGPRSFSYNDTTQTFISFTTYPASTTANVVSVSSATVNSNVGTYYIQIICSLANYPQVTTSVVSTVQILGCKPTGWSAASYLTATQTYTIAQPFINIWIPPFTQTPSCGYSWKYTLTLQKTAATIGSSVSSTIFTAVNLPNADYIDATYPSVKYFNNPRVEVYTTDLTQSGTYIVTMKATLNEFYYNQSLNVNEMNSFTLTIIDPCISGNSVNAFLTPYISWNRVLINMATTVMGVPDVNYFNEFADLYSLKQDEIAYNLNPVYSVDPLDGVTLIPEPFYYTSTTGYTTCGPRLYTLGGDCNVNCTYLALDTTAMTLTAQTDLFTDVNYLSNTNQGYSVTLTACLQNYPLICSPAQQFYVKVGQCQITSLQFNPTFQPNIIYNIFDVDRIQNLNPVVQTPACGWNQTYSYYVLDSTIPIPTNLTTTPAWLVLNTAIPSWKIASITIADAGVYRVYQKVTLDNALYTSLISSSRTISFSVTLIDPCQQTKITPQNNAGESFDIYNWNNYIPKITTSVLFGTDFGSTAQSVDLIFPRHDDQISIDYRPANLNTSYVCGNRTYSLVILGMPNTTFVQVIDDPASTEITLSTSTAFDIDVGVWPIYLIVTLQTYTNISFVERYYVNITNCKINQIFVQPLFSSDALAYIYQSSSPYIYDIGDQPATIQPYLYVNLEPRCNYTTRNQIQIVNQTNAIANETNLGLLTQQTPYALFSPDTTFYSQDYKLDLCTYDIVNQSLCVVTNPYYLLFYFYIDDPRALAVSNVTNNSDTYFYVWPRDRCRQTNLIPQNNARESFDIYNWNNQIPIITTSVLFGTDFGSTAQSVDFKFPRHDDQISFDYRPANLNTSYVCGNRTYSLVISGMPNTTFVQVIDDPASTDIILSTATAFDIDLGVWPIYLTVKLQYNPNIQFVERFWVNITNCIIEKFFIQPLNYSDPLAQIFQRNTPFIYDIYAISTVSPYQNIILEPKCNYTIKNQILLIDFNNEIANSTNLGLIQDEKDPYKLVSPEVNFNARSTNLDLCNYNQTDQSLCVDINPYYLMLHIYIDDPTAINITNVTLQNNDTKFYVWPKDPCRSAVLFPDLKINKGQDFLYYIGAEQEFLAVQITNDSISLDTEKFEFYTQRFGYELCGLRSYKVVSSEKDDTSRLATTQETPSLSSNPYISIKSNNRDFVGENSLMLKSWLTEYPWITAYSPFKIICSLQKIVIPPPYFIDKLVDQTIIIGQQMEQYQLPQLNSPNQSPVSITLTSILPKWLVFNQEQQYFYQIEGSIKLKDKGIYVIKLEISDKAGGSDNVFFTINIQEPQIDNSVDLIKLKAPIPKINQITNRGMLTINWNKNIKIPRNLTLTKLTNRTWFNESRNVNEVRPGLEIKVIPSWESDINELNFTWQYSSWTSNEIKIQLFWQNTTAISQYDTKECLQIIFYASELFVETEYGAPVIGGSDNNVLISIVPKQIQIFDAIVKKKTGRNAGLSGDLGQYIFQCGLYFFLNNLWEMVSTFQLIVLIPLMKVKLPDNVNQYSYYLMKIAAFDIIPTDDMYYALFQIKETPAALTENFSIEGFVTTYFYFNLGSLVFFLYAFPFQVLLSQILKQFSGCKAMVRIALQIERYIYWNQTIRLLYTSYTILVLCVFIQLTNLQFNDKNGWGPQFCSYSAIFYLCVCLIFPIFEFVLCWRNFDILSERSFQKRFGSIWQNKNVENKGFIIFNLYYCLRRLMLGAVLVFSKDILFFQISGIIFQTMIQIIVVNKTRPFKNRRQNYVEYFNDIIILLIMYNMICFTDLQPNLKIQYKQGYIIIFCVFLQICFNLLLVLLDLIADYKKKWRKYRLMRKYAKSRSEKHRKQQKKKRHERWKAQTEIIIKKKLEEKSGKLVPVVEVIKKKIENYKYQEVNEISEKISSVEESQNNLNQHDIIGSATALFSKKPVDDVPKKDKLVNTAGQTQIQENKQHAPKVKSSERNVLEKKIHKQLKKGMPLDPYVDDPLAVFNQDEPEEWQDQNLVQKLGRKQPAEKQITMDQTLLIHNQIARQAFGDPFKKNRIKPVSYEKQGGHRIVADANDIHSRLFLQMDPGDGPKFNSQLQLKKMRKMIVPKKEIIKPNWIGAQKPFVVPRMKEDIMEEELAKQKQQLEQKDGESNQQDKINVQSQNIDVSFDL